uniref:Integrase, catalytic region, zinc finger, CCHC-type, peptidase aspartic, catalytic n=1 Tax=Tanacetum cinerariifolium TaxID=118510 RepID=A0A6L2LGR3_TANCI|nr:hypothetical protein [Tanacetum cinerariifolium]
MILESLEHGPLIWPTVEENVVTRTKKYVELSATEKIQADYDMKATKYQYLSLPPEWSKFVTDVKLVKDFHTTKFDKLQAYLEQHELHANEVHLLRECNQDLLAFVANQQMTPPYFNASQSSYNNPQLQQQFPPSQYGSIHPTQHYSSTYPSQPQFNHSSVPPSYPYQSQMNHQTSSIPQIAYQLPQVSTQPITESPLVDSIFIVLTKDLDTYDSNCDDISNTKAVLMANISNYGSDVISEVPHSETYLNDMKNQSVHAMHDFEQTPVVDSKPFRTLNIYKKHNRKMFKILIYSTHVNKASNFYDNIHKQALGYQNLFYLKKAQQIKPTLYDGIVISNKHVVMLVIDDEETLILEEVSRSNMSEKEKDPKAIKQNISHKPIDYVKVNKLYEDFGKSFVPQPELSADEAF